MITKNTIKQIASLRQQKFRKELGLFVVEGRKMVDELLLSDLETVGLYATETYLIEHPSPTAEPVSEVQMQQMSGQDTPPGILAVVKIPAQGDIKTTSRLILALDGIANPGNMGTLIRICDAVGAKLLLSPGCVDIYSPKTVRASMGSFFHTRICENVAYRELEAMTKSGYTLIAGALAGETADYRDNVYGEKTVIIVGNEANGVSKELIASSDKCVKIPIYGKAESLNAAVAAAVILYKAKEFK